MRLFLQARGADQESFAARKAVRQATGKVARYQTTTLVQLGLWDLVRLEFGADVLAPQRRFGQGAVLSPADLDGWIFMFYKSVNSHFAAGTRRVWRAASASGEVDVVRGGILRGKDRRGSKTERASTESAGSDDGERKQAIVFHALSASLPAGTTSRIAWRVACARGPLRINLSSSRSRWVMWTCSSAKRHLSTASARACTSSDAAAGCTHIQHVLPPTCASSASTVGPHRNVTGAINCLNSLPGQ